MGIVYRAQQLEPERIVALKMLLPQQLDSAEMRERFRLEVRAIAALEHPAILPVYQVGEHEGMPYFTMKLATGGTLVSRAGQFKGGFREIAELLITLAEAVHFAHERGVLHRDLKPGNILFDDAGRAYVSDFGLAKFTEFAENDTPAALTRSIHLLGTPQFFPPEVASGGVGQATTACDLYSLGAILYELLAGRAPFVGEGLTALLKAIVEQEPPRPSKFFPGVPHELEIICLKCLVKEPSQRYGSAKELAEDLRRWLEGRAILARPVSVAARVRQWMHRNPALATVSLLLLLALTAGGILQLRTNGNLRRAVANANGALQQSLVAQAGLKRASSGMGQRFGTLELIARALSLDNDTSATDLQVSLRTETAGALSLPDLRTVSRWPVQVSHFEASVSFSDDLSRFATALQEGGVAVYATADRHQLQAFPGPKDNPAISFKFSPDGDWVAATFQDGHAEIYSVDAAHQAGIVAGQPAVRTVVEFLRDNRGVIVASQTEGLFSVDLMSGVRHALMPSLANCTALAVDKLGEQVSVLAQKAIHVVRVTDGSNVWSKPLTGAGTWADWSPDGRRLVIAIGQPSSEELVFDAVTGQVLEVFHDHDVAVGRVVFHPDGRSIISTSWDGRLVWRELAKDGFRFLSQGGPRLLRFSLDGKKLAYEPSHGEAGIYEIVQPAIFKEWQAPTPDGEASVLCLSPDGHLAATSSGSGVHLWDTTSRAEISFIPESRRTWYVMALFHPDGKSLLYSGVGIGINQVELLRDDQTTPGQPPLRVGPSRKLRGSDDFIALEFAPDGRSLIVGENKQSVKNERRSPDIWLWPDADPSRARKLASDWQLIGYHMTKDGRWGLTSHFIEPDITVWDPATGQRVKGLGLSGPVFFELTPDGRWILASTREEYQLLEIGSWQLRARWQAQFGQQHYRCCAFSPDGSLVATAAPNGRVDLRTLPEANELIRLPSPKITQIKAMQFSADGNKLFVLTGTGGIQEWNLKLLHEQLAGLRLDWKIAQNSR